MNDETITALKLLRDNVKEQGAILFDKVVAKTASDMIIEDRGGNGYKSDGVLLMEKAVLDLIDDMLGVNEWVMKL